MDNNFIKVDTNAISEEQYAERMKRARLRRERERKLRRQRRIIITVITFVVVAVLTILFALLFRACSNDKDTSNSSIQTELQGIWAIDNVTKYEFKSDGTGTMLLPDNSYEFVYEISDNTITIDFESELVIDTSYSYNIDNNKLAITDIKHTDITYTMTREK